jgi:general secretion pathway protein K
MTQSIATESKMFSIYADGIVPGYQRKTKVRVHAVVDFRNAPPPGLAPTPGGMGADGGVPPATRNPVTGAPVTGAPTGGSIDALMAALAPNPAGTIIYFRVE